MSRPEPRAEPEPAAREVYRLLLRACFSKDLAALQRALAGRGADDTVDTAYTGSDSFLITPSTLSPIVTAALGLPTGPTQGLAPLHAAVLTGFPAGVKLLLAAGVPPDSRTGGAAAIKRAVQLYPCAHVKLVQRWWGGLRGGSTALALALDTLELVRRRERGDRDNRYGRFLAGYRLCVEVLLEGGADPLLRADATGPVTVLGSHPRSDLWEAVLRRRLHWLLASPAGSQSTGGTGQGCSSGAAAADDVCSGSHGCQPLDRRPSAQAASAVRWLGGLSMTQAADLLFAAAAVGEPEQAAELVRLAAPLTPAQAEVMLRTLADWHRYTFNQAQAQLVCCLLDACEPGLSAAALASADLAQQGLEDLLCSVAEVPHLGAVQRLLALGAPLAWDTLLTAARHAARKRREEDSAEQRARPSRFVLLVGPGEGAAEGAEEEAAPVPEAEEGAAVVGGAQAAAAAVPAASQLGRDPPEAWAALEVLRALLRGAAALPQPELGTPEAAVELEDDSCAFAWLAARRTQGSSEDWPPVYSERRLVAAAELLLAAGYRPARLAWAWHLPEGAQEPLLLRDYCPFDEAVAAQGTQLSRMLRLAVDRPPWSLASHHHFPPAFRDATRTVLLAARRRQRGAHAAGVASAAPTQPARCSHLGAGPASPDWLADLPGNALLVAIGLAAYPLSQWL